MVSIDEERTKSLAALLLGEKGDTPAAVSDGSGRSRAIMRRMRLGEEWGCRAGWRRTEMGEMGDGRDGRWGGLGLGG